jgi:hypothetical protein
LVAGEGLEAYLPLADMIDISAEVERLSKRLSKMQTEYDGLKARLSSPKVCTHLLLVDALCFTMHLHKVCSILKNIVMLYSKTSQVGNKCTTSQFTGTIVCCIHKIGTNMLLFRFYCHVKSLSLLKRRNAENQIFPNQTRNPVI